MLRERKLTWGDRIAYAVAFALLLWAMFYLEVR